jgi:hypothetical protein
MGPNKQMGILSKTCMTILIKLMETICLNKSAYVVSAEIVYNGRALGAQTKNTDCVETGLSDRWISFLLSIQRTLVVHRATVNIVSRVTSQDKTYTTCEKVCAVSSHRFFNFT